MGLLLAGLAPAQQGTSVYGGVFRSSQRVQVSVDAPRGTVFTLARVPEPQALFLASRDPHRPSIPSGTRTVLVRTIRPARSGGYQQLDLGRLPGGVYLVRANGVGAVVLVSDLGLVVKRDAQTALTYTADRDSGQTRAAKVWAMGSGTAPVTADTDGVARFARTIPTRSDSEYYLARSGNDWAVSGAGWNSYAAPLVRGYVYSDRPVYRPGQHVDFKAVLRKAGSLAPLANTAVRVRVLSPFDEEVFRGTLTTNRYGSLSAGLDLPVGAKLGDYRFDLEPDGADGDGQADIAGGFGVEAYQKPEYQVTLTPDRARAVQGERVKVHVSARYLFGGALGGARVNYNVTRAPYYPPGFDTDFLGPDDGGPDYGSDLVVQEETRLNAQGDLDLTLPLEKAEDGRPVSYRVEAEVEDESRRVVSAQTRVIAFPASLNVEASTDGYVYDAGKVIGVTLDTRDLNDVGRAAPVTLDLVRQNWDYAKGKWTFSETRLARTQVRTDASGRGRATLRATRGGGYLVRATVRDPGGRTSRFENFVWVLKPGEDWGWNYRDMSVRLDKKTYTPGDTATALIGNPHPGAPVLVTLEGDHIRKSVVLRSKSAALTYRFPVTADMSPNVFVGAAALGDGNFYASAGRVTVPRAGAALSVKVTPDRARYAPGDTGTLKVQVRDAKGQGVPAEVALGVVDQAIYLVRPDAAAPITTVFDALRDNAVGTQSSVDFYFESGPVAAAPRAALTEASFAQGKEENAAPQSQSEVKPRTDFRDTILWVPGLLTDGQGQASVQVRFPDNLTTWVATARAQTGSPRFGQTTASTLVTKDVIARLSLPPFLVRGDRVTLSGVVNNTLNRAVGGSASASFTGLTGVSGAVLKADGTDLKLAANGRARQDFDVRADRVGTAKVTFTARTGSGSDALTLPIPVQPRGYAITRTAVGGAGTPLGFTLPRDVNADTLSLGLDLTPSLLSAVSPALEYLAGYPYGCTEQTMSRFLPALLARQTLGVTALPKTLQQELPDITSAGLARLALFQHEDGGWNFWQWDDSTLEMTAYVVEGLTRARSIGVKVDNSMLDRALKYLAANVGDKDAEQAERARAYRVLASAGRAKADDLAAFARRKELQPYALAQMALALKQVGQNQASQDVLDRLLARRISGGGLVHWEKPGQRSWWDYWDDNSVQVTAAALEAITRLAPQSKLRPGIVQWLLSQRRGPQWVSTQDTTSVIIAALAGGKAQAGQAATVQIKLDGQDVGSVQLGADGQAGHLDLKARDLKPGEHQIMLEGAPQGLSAAATLKYAREPAELKGDASHGLKLSRVYERLTPTWDARKQRYTYTRTPLLRAGQLQSVTVGDLILVTLTVQPTEAFARYLLVSDPIPAGMRALDDRALSIAGVNADDEDEGDWEGYWNYWYAGRDLQDDRVDLYADYLEGPQQMTYVLRAQTPGTFAALPSHAFLMYEPDVEGYGPAATLSVRDRGQ